MKKSLRLEQKIGDLERMNSTLKSKLFNDYICIRNLREEHRFLQEKYSVISSENEKISEIIFELNERRVRDC